MLLLIERALENPLSERPEICLDKLHSPEFVNETILFYSAWQSANQSIFEQPFDRRVDCSLHILLCRKYGAVVLPTIATCYSDGTCNQNMVGGGVFQFNVHDADQFVEMLEKLRIKLPVLRRYDFSIQHVSDDEAEALISPNGQDKLLDLSERKIMRFCQLHQFDNHPILITRDNVNGVLQSSHTLIVFGQKRILTEFVTRYPTKRPGVTYCLDSDQILCEENSVCVTKLTGEELRFRTVLNTDKQNPEALLHLLDSEIDSFPRASFT